jgi:phosphoribosylanthranilate isomerase
VTLIVKMCGITRVEDAVSAMAAGADWLGLNFYATSKRSVTPEGGKRLVDDIRKQAPSAVLVGVFVNGDAALIEDVEGCFDYLQFHGDETPEACMRWGKRVIKAFRPANAEDVAAIDGFPGNIILIDTPSVEYGGSGQVGDWQLAKQAMQSGRKVVLAGGLTPENVARAVAEVRPFGVDVASGIETAPGKKDPEKMRRFVAAARSAFTKAAS